MRTRMAAMHDLRAEPRPRGGDPHPRRPPEARAGDREPGARWSWMDAQPRTTADGFARAARP